MIKGNQKATFMSKISHTRSGFEKAAIFFLLGGIIALPLANAVEVDDRYTQMRQEEINAKQAKSEELANKILTLQKQLEEERKALAKSQEKIWNEYTQSLETDRKKLKDQMLVLDERQKMFEEELNKKRDQDQLTIQDKQDLIKSSMLEVERLRAELVEDRKAFEAHVQELKNRPQTSIQESSTNKNSNDKSSEVLSNNVIKVANGPLREILGDEQYRSRNVRPEYYVEIGDILDIDVWRVPDLSRSVPVRPDGRISMPVVGDLDVVGLSLVEVRDLLTQKFSEYVWNPQVSISIRQFGGRKFIILGEVGGPGVYRYQNDINLVEAIALAGGFRESSRRGKIMVIRGDIRKQPQVKIITANLQNLLAKGMLTENIAIMPNDIIYVGKDLVSDYKDVITNVINPFFDTAINYFVLHAASRTDHNS